ncbi:MAG TPA: hypothetical protein VJ725_23975 [Thermoanaerobaculia bacterium]|nr:hypothetical protein [Thermoanaerobaculia bacterium]
MKQTWTCRLALLLPLLLPTAALARDPGSEFRVSAGSGNEASAGMDDEGGFVVSWVSSNYGVKARRFAPDGKPASGEFEVGHASGYYSGDTSAALDRSGFLVVWENLYKYGGGYLRGQRVDRDGHPLLSQPFAPRGARHPNVASDPQGSSVIVGTYSSAVVANRRNSAGQPVGRTIRVAQGSAPDVTVDAAGNFVVAWSHGGGILARRYSADGAPRGEAFQVAEPVEDLSNLVLAGNRQGHFAVAWQTGTSVWVRFFSFSGEPRTGPVRVTDMIGSDSNITAAMDAEGQVLVSWDCCFYSPGKFTIYGRWLESSGALSGRVFPISSGTVNQIRPDAASGPKNRFVVVWDGPLTSAEGAPWPIHGRRLTFARPGDDPCLLQSGGFACDTAHDGGEEEILISFRGPESDTPLLGDLDGDGDDDPCRYRPGRFLCDVAHDGGTPELTLAFGRAGDLPLLGDLDGEGRDDACVYRGNQFLCDSAHNGGTPELIVSFGRAGDLPFLADVDGDGDDDPCVARDGLLLCDQEHDGGSEDFSLSIDFGAQGDVLLLGDVDDDHRADPCVYRDGRFLCDTKRDGSADLVIPFAFRGAVPLLGNVDGL